MATTMGGVGWWRTAASRSLRLSACSGCSRVPRCPRAGVQPLEALADEGAEGIAGGAVRADAGERHRAGDRAERGELLLERHRERRHRRGVVPLNLADRHRLPLTGNIEREAA